MESLPSLPVNRKKPVPLAARASPQSVGLVCRSIPVKCDFTSGISRPGTRFRQSQTCVGNGLTTGAPASNDDLMFLQSSRRRFRNGELKHRFSPYFNIVLLAAALYEQERVFTALLLWLRYRDAMALVERPDCDAAS